MRSTQPEGHLSPPQQRNQHLPFESQSSASPPLLIMVLVFCVSLCLCTWWWWRRRWWLGWMMNDDDSIDALSKERKRFQLLDEHWAVYCHIITPPYLQSSREPSHISNPDFDPPSKLLQNVFSYIHEENEASIDCIYISGRKWCGRRDQTSSQVTYRQISHSRGGWTSVKLECEEKYDERM